MSDSGAARSGDGVDKRIAPRARRRLMVRFGPKGPEKTAFSGNISETGMFLRTNVVYAPGTTLHVEIAFPDQKINLWGRVAWAKKVPPQLAHVIECGMGIAFLEPPADWYTFFEAWQKQVGA